MAASYAFAPSGATIFVGATAVQIGPAPAGTNSWRVRNLSASAQYFTHGRDATVTSVGAPGGSPSANTIGMLPSSVEVFTGFLPFMIASSATGFEVTPGDGA